MTTGDELHNAFNAGRELGLAERFNLELTEAVHEVLHQQVREMLGLARRSAVHGPAFSRLVTESGERE